MVGLSRSRWTTVLCFLLLIGATSVFFHRVLLHPDRMLASFDIGEANSEYKYVQWRSFAEWGRFPLWDPTIFCGKSIVGDSLPTELNPPQWFFWLTPSPALFGYLLWFYATVGAWGMFLFARKKGCDPQGALLAALVFVLGGKTAGHLFAGHVEVLNTVLCLPWIMLAAERVLERPTLLRAGLLGTTLALVSTCGSIQILYWHFLFVSAYAALWLLAALHAKGWSATFRAAFAFAAGMLSFLFFAAPWWFPIVRQTLLLTARARGADFQFAASFSPQYADLLHLVWPFHGLPPLATARTAVGVQCFYEKTLYFGAIPLALLLPACLWPGKHRIPVIILAVLTALTFLLALGKLTPLFWLATRAIPGFVLFRCPGRMFFYTAFTVALLVGLFISDGGVRARRWALLAVSVALWAAVVVAALLLWRSGFEPIRRVWLPIVLLTLFVPLVILWMREVLPDKYWKAAILVLVCCDLFVVWGDHVRVAKTEDYLQETADLAFLAEQRHKEEFRLFGTNAIIGQTYAAKYGLETVDGYHPGMYGRFWDLYMKIWPSGMTENDALKTHSPKNIAHPVILDLMNVGYLVVSSDDAGFGGQRGMAPPTVWGTQAVRIFRRESALPRVCLVPRADLTAPGIALLDALCAMDPKAGCLVEDRPFQGGDAYRPLPFERHSPSDLTVRFTSEKGGVVVISQAWHPDWRARDNGELAEVRRVNYDFVGVCVPPGDHEIRVWYWPWDFYLGCYVAAAAWTMLALLGAWAAWKKRRPARGV